MSLFNPVAVNAAIQYDSIAPEMRGKTVSVRQMYKDAAKPFVKDAKLHDANFAFLTTQLAKLYNNLVEPKHFVTYAKDIDIDNGGGFVDYVQYYTVNYAGIAEETRNIVGNGANYIPRVNAGLTQETANVYTFQIAYDIRFIELEKMKKLQLQKSLESVYQDAILVAWDLFVQKVAYTGMDANHKGLFNHDDIVPVNVTSLSKAAIEAGTTPDSEIVGLFNGVISNILTNSNMNVELLPDTFLVPVWFGAALTNRFSNMYTNSLRNYIVEHNLVVDESDGKIKIRIESRPDLNNAGTLSSGRMVAYKKDKSFLRMDMPYPIKHYITLPNIERISYTTTFVGQVSEVQMPYNTSNTDAASPVQYYDFAA